MSFMGMLVNLSLVRQHFPREVGCAGVGPWHLWVCWSTLFLPAILLSRSAVLGQGCGKTTLVEQLEALFEHTGGKAAVFSMDDCYLTRADQEQLAKVSHLVQPDPPSILQLICDIALVLHGASLLTHNPLAFVHSNNPGTTFCEGCCLMGFLASFVCTALPLIDVLTNK